MKNPFLLFIIFILVINIIHSESQIKYSLDIKSWEFEKMKENKVFKLLQDTAKTGASENKSHKYYIISGSFLIPNNAEKQVGFLKKSGFTKAHKYNFPESEYYSVIVDVFERETDCIPITQQLKQKHIDYFIRHL